MGGKGFMLVYLILLLTLAALSAYFFVNRTVEFSDANLEKAIRETLAKPEGNLRKSELASVKELDARGRGIRNLSGMENLVNLAVLNLEDNKVENVTPLRHVKSLQELSLRNNGITDLSALDFAALQELPELKKLSLRHNVVRFGDSSQVRLSDISILEGFTSLENLELRDNHIEDIRPVGHLQNLETLDISHNPLKEGDISPLKGLTRLKELNIRETAVTDLSPLQNLQGLIYLNIHSNSKIITIKPLGNLTNLQVLIMRNVPVGEDIEVLAGLVHLYRLNLRNCSVENLSVLGSLMAGGALQDEGEMEADVDVRDNPIPENSLTGTDGYAPVRPYWDNITHKQPVILPTADGS